MTDPNARLRGPGVIAGLVQDGLALGGAALITYGAELVYHPAGFIVGGAFLLVGSWLAARTYG